MSDPNDSWQHQQSGTGCYLCPPQRSAKTDILLIAQLAVATLYLIQDQRFRGHSVLILNNHATAFDTLSESTYSAFMDDLRRSAVAIRTVVSPDHMNVALLGNTCPHLHWAIVPRFRADPRWGKPVWEDSTLQVMHAHPQLLSAAEYSSVVAAIATALAAT